MKAKRSFIKYVGGKNYLARHIIALIPEHVTYAEPFMGAGHVFFQKTKSFTEILNDLNDDLTNLFLVVRNKFDDFLSALDWLIASKKQFEIYKHMNTEGLSDVERAVRYYFLLQLSFSADVKTPNFSVKLSRRPHLNSDYALEKLRYCHYRLKNAFILNMDYKDFISYLNGLVDAENIFYYIDPPYYGVKDYTLSFSKNDFYELHETLKTIKGKFLMSMNNHEFIKDLFKDYNIMEIENINCLGENRGKTTELFIMNYEPSQKQLSLFSEK